jgi:hypothetical protein
MILQWALKITKNGERFAARTERFCTRAKFWQQSAPTFHLEHQSPWIFYAARAQVPSHVSCKVVHAQNCSDNQVKRNIVRYFGREQILAAFASQGSPRAPISSNFLAARAQLPSVLSSRCRGRRAGTGRWGGSPRTIRGGGIEEGRWEGCATRREFVFRSPCRSGRQNNDAEQYFAVSPASRRHRMMGRLSANYLGWWDRRGTMWSNNGLRRHGC